MVGWRWCQHRWIWSASSGTSVRFDSASTAHHHTVTLFRDAPFGQNHRPHRQQKRVVLGSHPDGERGRAASGGTPHQRPHQSPSGNVDRVTAGRPDRGCDPDPTRPQRAPQRAGPIARYRLRLHLRIHVVSYKKWRDGTFGRRIASPRHRLFTHYRYRLAATWLQQTLSMQAPSSNLTGDDGGSP